MCTKQCRTCGEVKPLSDFPYQKKYGFRGDSPGCYRPDCKRCTADAARRYRETYTKRSRYRQGVDRQWYSACSCRCGDAATRAKARGLQCEITTDYMYDLLVAQGTRCAISGIELTLEKGTPHVLSIDQIDAGKGYVPGNVQWVSWAVNRAKGDLSHAEFLSMCLAIVRCNDYPAREYAQASGSATHGDARDDIV